MPPNATAVSPILDRIQLLEAENQAFKESQGEGVKFETLHNIFDYRTQKEIKFVDEPTWGIGPRGEAKLQGHFPIYDLEGFLKQKHDVAFVVLKNYDQDEQRQDAEDAFQAKKALPRPKPSSEAIRLLSTPMIEAVNEFLARQPNAPTEFPDFNAQTPISAPYLFWYHYRSPDALDKLHGTHQVLMRVLTAWIDEQYGDLYARVDDQFQRVVTSAETLEFLFKPGDVMIWKEKNEIAAAIARSRPIPKTRPRPNTSRNYQISPLTLKKNASNSKWRWQVQTWQYYYDGSFIQKNITNQIIMQSDAQDEEVPISELTVYPLKYASDTVRSRLQVRGETFWKCRYRRLVSYKDEKGVHGTNERFMVDFETYEELHSDSANFKTLYSKSDDKSQQRMDPAVMASETPPAAPEIYVFPRAIMGYNLRTKKWVDLEVDLIQDVAWNKKSFEHLVVDNETKELVQALVTHQIEREQNTDVIESKGNGLIILLHGGPGTGKTFTAESVAEMAEKPLFRVTCGDIGTKPEDVEKYLESVLYLGKIWGCVVLLDEADVFLEQRSLTDLERNALVSVFLRVLEYYEGILILTSNRVGTFDEAFKSRIQLALHYHNLTEGQRWKIWKNFLTRLKTLETGSSITTSTSEGGGGDGVIRGLSQRTNSIDPVGIDFDDVECYLGDLAKYELNGRQIRNSITTARQLAKFKGENMSYHHLRHVITVSGKFDAYLKTVQEGFSDDQVARGDGIR
ncbi:P-loop containing nucleoside triphosphate hydrolase protein [Xylaria telfairii]|nr:P-loop containing nucleoside triphosphate hydrolase protein [Xylaria telfairii]